MSWQRRLAIAMAIGLVCGIYVTMHGWANPDFVSDFDQVWAGARALGTATADLAAGNPLRDPPPPLLRGARAGKAAPGTLTLPGAPSAVTLEAGGVQCGSMPGCPATT